MAGLDMWNKVDQAKLDLDKLTQVKDELSGLASGIYSKHNLDTVRCNAGWMFFGFGRNDTSEALHRVLEIICLMHGLLIHKLVTKAGGNKINLLFEAPAGIKCEFVYNKKWFSVCLEDIFNLPMDTFKEIVYGDVNVFLENTELWVNGVYGSAKIAPYSYATVNDACFKNLSYHKLYEILKEAY